MFITFVLVVDYVLELMETAELNVQLVEAEMYKAFIFCFILL